MLNIPELRGYIAVPVWRKNEPAEKGYEEMEAEISRCGV